MQRTNLDMLLLVRVLREVILKCGDEDRERYHTHELSVNQLVRPRSVPRRRIITWIEEDEKLRIETRTHLHNQHEKCVAQLKGETTTTTKPHTTINRSSTHQDLFA